MSKQAINSPRRRLGTAALATLILAVTPRGHAASATATAHDLLAQRIAGLFRRGRGLARVGAETIVRGTAPKHAPAILEALATDADISVGQLRALTDAQLRSWLLKRQRDDYAHTRIVRVRGWLLSVTEARLCALCAVVRGAVP